MGMARDQYSPLDYALLQRFYHHYATVLGYSVIHPTSPSKGHRIFLSSKLYEMLYLLYCIQNHKIATSCDLLTYFKYCIQCIKIFCLHRRYGTGLYLLYVPLLFFTTSSMHFVMCTLFFSICSMHSVV
jgi:hypothetical protein